MLWRSCRYGALAIAALLGAGASCSATGGGSKDGQGGTGASVGTGGTGTTGTTDFDAGTDDAGPTDSCDIDMLVVLDTSGSMFDAAANLREIAFPSFLQQLANYPHLGDYRIAVVRHMYGTNPAGSAGNSNDSLFLTKGFDPAYACQKLVDGCDAEGHEYELLGGSAKYYLCDDVPEAGHQIDCNFAGGQVWMQGPASTLADEFGCVGRFACHQYADLKERPVRAALEALEEPGNQGFLRDKALLVVMILTDEEDESSGLSYQQIHDELLALKGGDEKYVVEVTLAGPEAGTVEINPIFHTMGCASADYGDYAECPKLVGFSKLFGDRGLHLNMCVDDISSALTKALDRLELSCDEIAKPK